MIVDIHTHTFPDQIASPTIQKLQDMGHTRPFSDGTVAGLTASMAAAGVDYSVILPVATSARQVVHINDASVRLNEQGIDRGILSFGCMHPDFPDWKGELARIASLGIKGIKLHPVYQNVDIDDIRFLRILDRAAEVGLLVLAHAGQDIGYPGKENCAPEMTARALKELGPIRLILAHMGGWRDWDQVEELLAGTGVYLDTAFALGQLWPSGDGYYGPSDLPLMEEEQFLRMVRTFGADHVLLGTDSPWGDQGENLTNLRAVALTQEEQQAILGGNAQRLLGLN